MTLKDRIQDDMKSAMRAKDQARLDAIRLLLAGIKRREVDERIMLDDTQVLAVVDKMVKQSQDAAAQFAQGGRQDLVDKENAGIAVWKSYLPAPLGGAELETLIDDAIRANGATSPKDMGKVVAALKPKVQGRADMGQVSAKVKQRLSALN